MLIGSGDSIRKWEDLWIPNLPHFRPNFCENASMDGAMVVSQQDSVGFFQIEGYV